MPHSNLFQQTCDENLQPALRSLCSTLAPSAHAIRFGLLCLSLTMTATAYAQNPTSGTASESTPPAALAAQHSVVRWTGSLPNEAGKAVQLQFSIYAEQSRGLALWTESQTVKLDAEGRYSVLLGASSSEGLPQSLFPAGEPRWVEAHLASESAENTRSLIAAVPYAYKSIDAETLAGRAATDYLTRDDLQSAVANSAMPINPVQINPVQITPVHISPDIAGTGTTNALALWTNSTTLGNSVMSQSGTSIGINTTTPASALDVNGTSILRGLTNVNNPAFATATAGSSSPLLELSSSAYNSSTKAAVAQRFAWENVFIGNNSASPSANLQLLFGSGTATPTATGLSISPNGKITFAPGQTFPGAGAGTITGVTTTSPLTGSGTSGTVTIGLNTTTLETTLNGKYAQLATGNYFSSTNGSIFTGPITGNSAATQYAIQGNTTSGYAIQGYATGTSGYGVNGYATGNGGVGVYGNATGNANGSSLPIGVLAHAFQGYGVKSAVDESNINYAAILGQANGASSSYTSILSNSSVSAGIWGDIANNNNVPLSVGIVGTNDNGWAGYYANNSASYPTIEAYNYNNSNIGTLFKTFKAGSAKGTCGIGGEGNLTCTGQMKSLVTTRGGERTVETYSMQSPENWMEDFGDAELHNGSAIVTIDPDFAETASATAKYHVFLTPRGDSKGLYVTNLTPTSFEVHESGGGTASIAFDYRIVGKRRGFESQRMTDVTEQFKAETATAPHLKGKALVPSR